MTRSLLATRHPRLFLASAALFLAAAAWPLLAQGNAPTPDDDSDFGQYVVAHQDSLAPFFTQNAGDFLRLAIPALLSMAGWVIFITMVVGWGLDVLMSRGFAFLYAPSLADWKRSIIYATGSLFIGLISGAVMSLLLALLVGTDQSRAMVPPALIVAVLATIVAQVIWILYLFRTRVGPSIVFYLALFVVHGLAGSLIARPLIGSRASPDITNYVDNVITPRLESDAQAKRGQLASLTGGSDTVQAKVNALQEQMAQADSDQQNLAREIEEKKNSDIYNFAAIIKERARGELETAREGLSAFPQKFPASPLVEQARTQLAAVNDQIGVEEAQRQQQEADAAKAAAAARAELLALAAKGQATLTEMRQALVGKSRAQVSDLLGPPSDTASDQWNYRQQMIVNPLTGEQAGLIVYFNEGAVQSVDYLHRGNAEGSD